MPGEQVWETDEDWLDRMGRVLAVYADIICQMRESPFTAADGWAWLTRMVNMGCQWYAFTNYSVSICV